MTYKPTGIVPLLLGIAFLAASCKSRNVPPPPQEGAQVPPAEYEQPPGEEIPMPPDERGGRFGYSGENEPPPAPPEPRNSPREVREMEASRSPSAPAEEEQEEEAPKPPPSSEGSSSSQMSYANPVPGNPLVVTLPGSNASLGQISIEKYDASGNATGEPLKRGTQVQIPDPNNPGKKIYFKVP
ncbi:MAG: hypothetical protein WD342_16315 [Verrucomicrobiales bacterium]